MAVRADGRAWADGGSEPPFPPLRAGKDSLCDPALREPNKQAYGVLDRRLAGRRHMAGGEYSIADMASYPWVLPERQGQNLDEFPHLKRWKEEIHARPATIRAYERGRAINTTPVVTKESVKVLFGQPANSTVR